MKKYIVSSLVGLFLVGMTAAAAYALFGNEQTLTLTTSTHVAQTTTWDLGRSTSNVAIAFRTNSGIGIVRGSVGASSAFRTLTTTATAAATTNHLYVMANPYRFVYVKYTSVSKAAKSLPVSYFSR